MEAKNKITTEQILERGFKHTYGGQYELDKIMLSVGIDHAKVFIENRYLMNIEFVEELHTVFFTITGKSLELVHECSTCG